MNHNSNNDTFAWPAGKKAALSLSFDDARPSQVERALPVLDAFGVPATFYVQCHNVERRLDDWRRAVARGHEIGNHTLSHPCTGNYAFSRANALEEYSLERMEPELTGASAAIHELLGVTPQTFAYPCGQTFVGRGEQLQSYVPLVARHFLAGRAIGESANDPAFADLAQLMSIVVDGATLEVVQAHVEKALKSGGWLILVAHDVGEPAYQTMSEAVLAAICRSAVDPAHGLWLDTVANVAAHIQTTRAGI